MQLPKQLLRMTTIDTMIEIQQDNKNAALLAEILGDSGATHFGILRVKTESDKVCKTPTIVYISADCSGSMSDSCKDGRSKMQQINHAITNILHIFAEKNDDVEILVGLDAFDDKIHETFDLVRVTPQNVQQLAMLVSQIHPIGSTNIELALKTAANRMKGYRETYPSHRCIHIQLTDGDANIGLSDPAKLAEIVDENYTNIFLGYGIEHNHPMLHTLGSKPRGDYRFIDKLENAGIVYGEVVHGILYPTIDVPEIHIENGEIYDWTTNEWSNSIKPSAIVSGIERIFHVRTANPLQICGEFTGIDMNAELRCEPSVLDNIDVLPDLIDSATGLRDIRDLTKYMFRHKTQILLAETHKYSMQPASNLGTLKEKLKDFYKEMKEYMTTESLLDDPFMKVLLDDIYISYKTIGTHLGQVYSGARQTSQGRQHTYTVTNIDEDSGSGRMTSGIMSPPLPRRMNALADDDDVYAFTPSKRLTARAYGGVALVDEELDNSLTEEYEILEHIMSDNTETTYTSPQMISLMRSASVPDRN